MPRFRTGFYVHELSELNDAIHAMQVSGVCVCVCVCVFLQSVIHSHCVSQRNHREPVSINIKLNENQSKRLWSAIKVCMCVFLFIDLFRIMFVLCASLMIQLS